MKQKIYYCEHCGNVAVKTVDSGVGMVCCDDEMRELKPNAGDDPKHVPVVTETPDGHIRVEIGREIHPSTPEHHIEFIYLETEHGGKIRYLDSSYIPIVEFCGCADKPMAVYTYCNRHGLWKTDLSKETFRVFNCF